MKKVYLVDSENVGDIWVPLLVTSQEEDAVFVFYTQKSPYMCYENVRMLKETDKDAVFIKCFEGNNALDFQLVTQLGYLLCEDAECEYVIVSNDAGFDTVVRYWRLRQMPVSRLSAKECVRQTKRKNKSDKRVSNEKKELENMDVFFDSAEIPFVEKCEDDLMILQQMQSDKAELESVNEPKAPHTAFERVHEVNEDIETAGNGTRAESIKSDEPESATQILPEQCANHEDEDVQGKIKGESQQSKKLAEMKNKESDDSDREADILSECMDSGEIECMASDSMQTHQIRMDEARDLITTLLGCISRENLAEFHNALVVFYGKNTGKQLYQEVKNDTEWNIKWMNMPVYGQEEKIDMYCRLIFAQNHLLEEYPKDFSSFLCQIGSKRDNLNSFRSALQGEYGKEKGMKYYSFLKSHIKIINHM